eukprot:COSAG01_NODE_7898_length_3001_cov_4.345968_5_plen_242_part_01
MACARRQTNREGKAPNLHGLQQVPWADLHTDRDGELLCTVVVRVAAAETPASEVFAIRRCQTAPRTEYTRRVGGRRGTAGPAAAEEDARTDARQVYPVLDGLGRHGIRGICGLVSSFAALLLEARICQSSHLRGYCCLAGGGEPPALPLPALPALRLRPPTLGLALLLRLGLGLGTTHCMVQYTHGEAAQVHCGSRCAAAVRFARPARCGHGRSIDGTISQAAGMQSWIRDLIDLKTQISVL